MIQQENTKRIEANEINSRKYNIRVTAFDYRRCKQVQTMPDGTANITVTTARDIIVLLMKDGLKLPEKISSKTHFASMH